MEVIDGIWVSTYFCTFSVLLQEVQYVTSSEQGLSASDIVAQTALLQAVRDAPC